MGKADLHIHTAYSHDGTATVAAVLEHATRHTDLDVIAITDHDTVDGALEALDLAPRYGIQVVPGIEISTLDGDLLALWVTEVIPRGLPMLETVNRVRRLGGLCVVPHPDLRWSWCADVRMLARLMHHPDVADVVVGAEAYNASIPRLRANRVCAAATAHLGLSPVGSSDAHILPMIGCGASAFPGATTSDLRTALLTGATRPVTRTRPRHFVALTVRQYLLRQLGYVHWSAPRPGSPIALRRATAELA